MQSFLNLSEITLTAMTLAFGTMETTILNTVARRQHMVSSAPSHASADKFVKSHHRHVPEGPSDLSELESDAGSLQRFQSEISEPPPEGTSLHKAIAPAKDVMLDLESHTKTHKITDAKRKFNTGYLTSATIVGSLTFVVALISWVFGWCIECQQEALEQWETSASIELDRAEIKNEEKEDEKKQKKEEEAANILLGLKEAVQKIANDTSESADQRKDHDNKELAILKNITGLVIEGRGKEHRALQGIISLKKVIEEVLENQSRVLAQLHDITELLGRIGREDNGKVEEEREVTIEEEEGKEGRAEHEEKEKEEK
ncbi:hypothetical protein TWF718_009721 [Orbilia javanica]|uniref:Transmembrane protein n=1 Tax=Orbilia javanica TaxID=47235 RepID=A0AAN8MSY3_9PEZI